MVEIWAVLDGEPEGNETFTVTLSNPTGGARLGEPVQTFVTVLENLAPAGLFRITPSINRSEQHSRVTVLLEIKGLKQMFHALTTEVTPKYVQMKTAEQSSSPCLSVTVWARPSAWSGRRRRARLWHLVRTPDELNRLLLFSFLRVRFICSFCLQRGIS